MKKLLQKYHIYILIIVLLFPALLLNLGKMPLIPDEATRALVALEMEYSGNLTTPTINGEYYFNKPPLYNWFLLTLFKLSGSASELIIRLPVVFFLLLYGIVIFLGLRNHTKAKTAFIAASAFITMGRVLFYDSMLGLIDMSFSLLIFLNFILLYHYLKKERYLLLFCFSYLITSLCFLLKGLPAVVFQGISLISAFLYFRHWKKLFSFSHAAGIILFLLITGTYYFQVWQDNPTMEYFTTLISESGKRTFVEYGFFSTLGHIFLFPASQLFHLLPWSVLALFLFKKVFYQTILKNHFLTYLGLIFLANLPVYWLSPETYPRYLFMLYPILLAVLIFFYQQTENTDSRTKKMIEQIFIGLLLLSAPAIIIIRFIYPFEGNPPSLYLIVITALLLLSLGLTGIRFRHFSLEILIAALLIIRISFNLIIIPERLQSSRTIHQRDQALKIGKMTSGTELQLIPWSGISHESSYYITRERECILPVTHNSPEPGIYYISSDRDPLKKNETLICRFETRWENTTLRLVRFH